MPPIFSREIEEKIIMTDGLVFQPRTSPCEVYCPAGNPIQKAHALIQENRVEEALGYIKSRNPFPGITGRVCAHPCELKCNRNEYDEGLSIRALERFAADHADLTRVAKPKRKERTGKKLAVIGSGPAGMTCAYFSALFGHEVTVFESSASLGGMPRTGIPDFRLPKDIVDREIGQVLEMGVRARTNTTVGKDISFDRILEDHDACLVAVGTWEEKRLDVPGGDLALPAVSFLKEVNLGLKKDIGNTVLIIGGGGVAFDCAFTAKRLGASEVHVLCVEGKDNMCASPEDVLQAEAESVIIHPSRMISKILKEDGKATGVEYFTISSFQFDENGRLSVKPLSNEMEVLPADTIISAIGEQPDFTFIEGNNPLNLTPQGTLETNPNTFETSIEGVFAAGDVVSGPSTVAQAVGSGRQAAVAIDRYLIGKHPTDQMTVAINGDGHVALEEAVGDVPPHVVAFEEILNIDYHEKTQRRSTEKLSVEASVRSFEEIDKGFGEEEAQCEAGRCFHCGHCTSCGCCVEDCPGHILNMTPEGPQVIFYDECWHCGCCRIACPNGAILYDFPLNMLV
ncbi:MAG: FAD-dependent oxidoreductase [Deltaproteobacteria bacterium]|nr:FAD-dependent oxidoreductase [Deltaproteobacteria bacterium]